MKSQELYIKCDMCVHFFLGRIHLSASQRESLTRISEVDVRSFSDM